MLDVQFKDNTVINCKTVVSVAKDTEMSLNMEGNTLENCDKIIEERDDKSLMEVLGLKEDTPLEKFLEVLETLSNETSVDRVFVDEQIKKTKLSDYINLAKCQNVASLGYSLLQLATNPKLKTIIESIKLNLGWVFPKFSVN